MERHIKGQLGRIDHGEYAGAAPLLKHIFLTGDLRQATPHPFVRDERIEVVLCYYEPGDDGIYHWHPQITEYEMVIEGEVGYFEVGKGNTHWFQAGDFCIIPAGVCVKRIVRRSTRTVAVKVPSVNEKVCCSSCRRECTWRVAPMRET